MGVSVYIERESKRDRESGIIRKILPSLTKN